MTESGKKQGTANPRQQRLSAALRENLKRRKAQARQLRERQNANQERTNPEDAGNRLEK